MKLDQINTHLGTGIYRIFWESGGKSIAAVGVTPNGSRWIAPTNWVSPAAIDKKLAKSIKSVKQLMV